LKGYYIPEGNRVVIYHLATYRDPDLWHEPDQFRPERWLGDEQFKNDHFDAFEPFSTGPRGCSGKVRTVSGIREFARC
jgi:cytochrome P450